MQDIIYYFEQPIEEKALKETFQGAFGIPLDYSHFEWRFLNNPFGKKVYVNYILSGNCLAAFYAVSPVKVTINGTEHKLALSNMTMTHPEHQGKGYFKNLALDLYQTLKSDGYSGVFGFANQNSHYGFRKNLGWIDLAELNSFHADQATLKVVAPGFNGSLRFKEEDINLNHIQLTASMRCSDQPVLPLRSEPFLNWRLLNNPIHKYYSLLISNTNGILGIIFYKYFKGGIDIMEYFFKDSADFTRYDLLHHGISYFIQNYKCSVNIWSNLHSDEHLFLEKTGFKNSHFITYFGIIPFTGNNMLTDYKNWHFRFMDSDVF